MTSENQIRALKVSEEIRRQEAQEDHAMDNLLRNVGNVQRKIYETKRVVERTGIFAGRELVLIALNALNARLGIARMREHCENLSDDSTNFDTSYDEALGGNRSEEAMLQ